MCANGSFFIAPKVKRERSTELGGKGEVEGASEGKRLGGGRIALERSHDIRYASISDPILGLSRRLRCGAS